MSLTPDERAWFARRAELTRAELDVLEPCLSDIAFRARMFRVPVAFDDRAGRLEAALVRYLIESRPDN